jgi:glutathione synthase
MRLGLVVNDVATEHPQYTTVRLALAARRRGHEVWLMGVGDLSHTAH